MEKGKITTSSLYGYTFDKEGNYIIDEKEAKAIRKIFDLYLKGYKINEIIIKIKELGCKIKTGRDSFSVCTIKGILRNEKYAGDMLLQKTTVNKVESRRSVDNTTKTQYYVENNHQVIISSETFLKVNELMNERDKKFNPNKTKITTLNKYSNYVYSLQAEKFYQSKVNHRNTKYEVKLLEIVDKNKNRVLEVKNIYYSHIDLMLDKAINIMLSDLKNLKEKLTYELELKVLSSQINDLINQKK